MRTALDRGSRTFVDLSSTQQFCLTWQIDVIHGGMTNALLSRSRAFAAGFQTTVDVLTFDPDHDYASVDAALRRTGEIDAGIHLVNLWDWLEQGRTLVAGDPASRTRKRLSPSGAVLQIDHLRADGSVLVRDRREPGSAGLRGRRVVTLYDTDGVAVQEWSSIWGLYRWWLDELRGTERSVMIADSKPMARFLASYHRPGVLTAHVVHGSHLAADGARWSDARRPILEQIDEFDLVVVLTDQQRRSLGERVGVKPQLRVIPNAIDLPPDVDLVEPRRGGVMLASLEPRKRVDHAIRAIAQARDLGADAVLDVYGDGSLRAALERQAADLTNPESVRFHGFVHGAAARLTEASFLLLTSTSEGSPLAVLEALAAGCIPIAYDIPFGPADVIEDGVTGFLVPPGDVAAMAERVTRILALDPDAESRIRMAARAAAYGYTADAVVEIWKEEFAAAWTRRSTVRRLNLRKLLRKALGPPA